MAVVVMVVVFAAAAAAAAAAVVVVVVVECWQVGSGCVSGGGRGSDGLRGSNLSKLSL